MNILHVAETIKGGVASYLEEILLFQVDKLGQENVKVLIPADHQNCLPASLKSKIITFSRNGRSITGFLRMTFTFLRALRKEKPDVVFFHSTFAGAFGRLALLFCYKILGRDLPKILYCAHGWVFSTTESPFRKWLYKRIESFLGNRITDKIIVISKSEEKLALDAGIKAKKLTMIYNGIAPFRLTKRKNPTTNHPINMLFIGRFDRQKGFDILLEALENIDKKLYRLHVIGEAVNNDKDFVIPTHIHQLGWLQKEQVLQHLQKADVVVMPSRWEGFGLVAIEAMACSTAVICSDCCSLPEIIDDKHTGYLFPANDTTSLTNVIKKAARNIPKLHEMGKKGQKKYLKMFTATTMNEKTLRVIQELATYA